MAVQLRRGTTVRRRQIVSAARKLIVKYGSEHVTVRKIAEEIGVSEGAIYRHFKSKREILSFLVDEVEAILISDLQRSHTDADGLTLETLEGVIRRHVSAVQQRSGIAFQVIAEIISLGDRRLNKKVYDLINKYVGCVSGILSDGIKSGAIRKDVDLEAAATLFFGVTQALVNIWTVSNYSFNLEQRYAAIWNVFREAVVKRT